MSAWRNQSKRSKYGAIKTIVDGIAFPSKLEAGVYQLLKLREMAGEIREIKLQQGVTLKEKCPTCGDGPVVFKVDFSAVDCVSGDLFYIEAKGAEVASFLKRKRLWKANPPARLEIWKGSAAYPRLTEVIG